MVDLSCNQHYFGGGGHLQKTPAHLQLLKGSRACISPWLVKTGVLRTWGTALHGGLLGVSSFRLCYQCECGVVGERDGCMDRILSDLGSCEPQGLQGKGGEGNWTCVPGEGRRRERWGGGA